MEPPDSDHALRTYRLHGGVDLFVYPTERFKTSLLNILLHRPLDGETSAAALVPALLRRGTERLPDLNAIARHLETLFGAGLDVGVFRFGERQVLSLRMDVVEDRYLFLGGRDLCRQGLTLLRDLLLSPRLEKGVFPRDTFEVERTNLRRYLEGIRGEKARYAYESCVRRMCAGEPYARGENGEADEVAVLDPAEVTRVWRETVTRAPLEVYVVGGQDPERIRDVVEELFCASREGAAPAPPGPAVRPRPRRVRRFTEQDDVVQARLVMGFRTDVDHDHALAVPLVVWNAVFGGGSCSRLFREVREKRSLAYYCGSTLDLAKGVAFVQAGIDVAMAGRVERLVRRQLTDLRRGRIDLTELRACKRQMRGAILSAGDSAGGIAGFFQERQAFGGVGSFAEAVKRLDRVTRADVARAAETVRLDTVYVLGRTGA